MTKSWLASTGASGFLLYVDPRDQVAHIDVCLREDTWQARERVVDKMVEIHSMFVDDVALSYGFASEDRCRQHDAQGSAPAPREFAVA